MHEKQSFSDEKWNYIETILKLKIFRQFTSVSGCAHGRTPRVHIKLVAKIEVSTRKTNKIDSHLWFSGRNIFSDKSKSIQLRWLTTERKEKSDKMEPIVLKEHNFW